MSRTMVSTSGSSGIAAEIYYTCVSVRRAPPSGQLRATRYPAARACPRTRSPTKPPGFDAGPRRSGGYRGDGEDPAAIGPQHAALVPRRAGVEDGDALGEVVGHRDRGALPRRVGIAGGREHGGNGGIRAKLQGEGRAAVRHALQAGGEAARHQWQDHLRLGIAQAAVELHDPGRAVGGDHQPRVEHAAERRPAAAHLRQGRR